MRATRSSARVAPVTAHCPGGTGALRVAGDYLHKLHPSAKIWLSDPTWANHGGIFAAAGMETAKYAYRDPKTNGLDFGAMIESLKKIPAGDVVLLHGCCHNPTGIDPTPEQWSEIGDVHQGRRRSAAGGLRLPGPGRRPGRRRRGPAHAV